MTQRESNVINGGMPLDDYGTISGVSRGVADDKRRLVQGEHPMAGFYNDAYLSDEEDGGITFDTRSKDEKSCFFRDGKRRIDFVLVWEEELIGGDTKPTSAQQPGQKRIKTIEEKKNLWRNKFLNNLRRGGLEMEEAIGIKEDVESEKKIIHYIKLFIPWEVMVIYAEELCMRAPLQAHPNPSVNWSARLLAMVRIPNLMSIEVPNQPLDYYTCQFRRSKLDRFLGSDNHMTYFNPTQRHQAAYEILQTTVYGKKKRAEIGIDRLIEEDVFTAAYPVHEGPYKLPDGYTAPEALNPRQILNQYWAKWGQWKKYQPLDHIREYFGEKIGIYFAWLGFYTAWLLPASIVGVLVFMYGVFTFNTNIVGQETCNKTHSFRMCPLCDEDIGCMYWNLSDVCLYAKVGYLFDNPGTVFYAIFVAFWAVTFLEYWKRKCASLSHHWDCMDFEEEEERPRPQYAALAPTFEKNPITGIKEPHFPKRDRVPRILSGIACIIVMMILVLVFIIAVILYRVLISIPLFQNPLLRSRALTIASLSSAVVNLILIMSLGKVYEKLAEKLTQWEMHRTQTDYEDQLIFKVFLFQFVNFYSSIFYIAFFKGRFVGFPGHYNKFLGLRNEECNNGGCLVELAQQLAVIMVGKQVINNCQEVLVPKMKTWLHQRKIGSAHQMTEKDRWEEDYELIEYEGLFEEYLEMVLQFGFITIFVAAFPLAPLFALLNNWLEIRLDASKLVCETRRPVAERAQDIGVWFSILDALAQLSVMSNAFLIAFTSEFLPKMMYQYRYNWTLTGYVNFTLSTSPPHTMNQTCRYKDYRDTQTGEYTMWYWHLLTVRLAFVILFEHIVFGINRLIDILVPDIPESLEVKMKRERFLAKQALADTDTLMVMARGKEDDDDDDETQHVKLEIPTKA
ncbi:anoctamin-7-like isoform X3 [Lineus longissimus]|uniref:anoctamin-7-like isoform X3 n=1 Tax=Lineus longissimus TaxID=88925 RepID=UPI00315D065D